jgi:hypothetical protein
VPEPPTVTPFHCKAGMMPIINAVPHRSVIAVPIATRYFVSGLTLVSAHAMTAARAGSFGHRSLLGV